MSVNPFQPLSKTMLPFDVVAFIIYQNGANARKIMTIDELIRMIPVGAKVLVDGVPLEECTVEITKNKYEAYKGIPPVKVCEFTKSVTVNFIPRNHY